MKTIWFQVRHATLANYSAVIVYNVGSNKLVPMAGSDDALIPSVFLGGDDAQVLSHFTILFKILPEASGQFCLPSFKEDDTGQKLTNIVA